MNIQTLSVDDVLFIHNALVVEFSDTKDPISPPGPRDHNLLSSAVSRQYTGTENKYKYPDIFSNAATLTFGICCDHPFHNGNKRTALVSMMAHLDKNKFSFFDVKQKDLYEMIINVALHNICVPKKSSNKNKSKYLDRYSPEDEINAIADWIKKRAKKITRGEKRITYRQLRRNLKRFDYYLESPNNNKINIVKYVVEKKGLFHKEEIIVPKRIGTIGYPNETSFVSIKAIKDVRKICQLREIDGVDSEAFYSEGEIIDSYINHFRNILKKLARN